MREIVTSCGEEPSVVLNTVTRTALRNAASIAGLMITTEAMVAEAPKKDEPMGGGHGGRWPRTMLSTSASVHFFQMPGGLRLP